MVDLEKPGYPTPTDRSQIQAGAELCQAQGKFRRVRLALDLYLI